MLDDDISKTRRKRDMHDLQALGERLLAVPAERLRTLPIPEKLLEAVLLAQRISAREGLRRQRQYIGRLMREVDAEALRLELDRDTVDQRAATRILHAAERWRERLIDEPQALAAWCRESGDAQAPLAALVESAVAEVRGGFAGRRYRELFRHLRSRLEARAKSARSAPSSDAKTGEPNDE